MKKKEDKIPCAALLHIRNMVALECPCRISKLLGPEIIQMRTSEYQTHKSGSKTGLIVAEIIIAGEITDEASNTSKYFEAESLFRFEMLKEDFKESNLNQK